MPSSTHRRVVGLPSNPRSRQPLQPASAHQQHEYPHPSLTGSAPRPRYMSSQGAQMLDIKTRVPEARHREDNVRKRYVRRSNDSSSTSSSSDRNIRNRAAQNQWISRTTVQSNDEMTYLMRDSDKDNNDYSDAATTNGYVWTRVAEVANVLTQEVSKVWAAGLGNGEDEEESHLVKVMRAYHLAKARVPSELPDWLFSERERGQGVLPRVDQPTEWRQGPVPHRLMPLPNASKSPPIKSMDVKSSTPLGQPRLSSADRLKQLRALRRERGA